MVGGCCLFRRAIGVPGMVYNEVAFAPHLQFARTLQGSRPRRKPRTSNATSDMKAISISGYLPVTGLAIRCTAELHWQSLQDVDAHLSDWGREDNHLLMDQIAKSTALSFSHSLCPPKAASDTSAVKKPTDSRTDLDTFDLLLIEHRPVIDPPDDGSPAIEPTFSPPVSAHHEAATSHNPRKSFEVNVSAESIKGLVILNSLDPFDMSQGTQGKKPKRTRDFSRQANTGKAIKNHSRKAKKAKTREKSTAELDPVPVDNIPMKEKEQEIHPLVFDEEVFQFPPTEDANVVKKQMCILEKIRGSSDVNPRLLIQGEEALFFILDFNSESKEENEGRRTRGLLPSPPQSQTLLRKKLNLFLAHSNSWRTIYQMRLGLDFAVSQEWIKDVVKNAPLKFNKTVLGTRLEDWLIAYIFFVDMIITILPHPFKVPVDRVQTFRRALTCFESYTKLNFQPNEYIPVDDRITPKDISTDRRLAMVWRYISNWTIQDCNYGWIRYCSHSIRKDRWGPFFKFVFAYSIDSLTERLGSATQSSP
ncbi:hypothetical protein VP01_1321g6 [Puccinia sorghi]|uniref:Uncharacterized protein n=1 Tax=Puccinia sorghi TaxID=27349 RepID=A0A0L6VMV8_9BASI|nr:hypothetical protein VP01_1321g6 [Puccinia sorghi]